MTEEELNHAEVLGDLKNLKRINRQCHNVKIQVQHSDRNVAQRCSDQSCCSASQLESFSFEAMLHNDAMTHCTRKSALLKHPPQFQQPNRVTCSCTIYTTCCMLCLAMSCYDSVYSQFPAPWLWMHLLQGAWHS